MIIRVAGYGIEQRASANLSARLASAYSSFVADEAPVAIIESIADAPADERTERARAVPNVERTGDRILVRGDDFHGEVTPTHVHVKGRAERFPTDSVLKVWLADRLLEEDGLLLHGCAIAGEQGAVVFVGDSGAGKSTLSRLATEGGLLALSDELCAVRWQNGVPFVHGTPWNVGVPRSAKLLGLGILAHSQTHVLAPAASVDVLRVLLPNALLPDTGPEGRAAIFRAASRLLANVGTYRLSFGLHPGVAEALRPLIGAGP